MPVLRMRCSCKEGNSMRGRLQPLTRNMHGKYIVSFEVDGDPRELCNTLNDCDVSIDIKRYRNHRSLEANNYAWLLIDKIAATMSLDKITVYKNAVRSIGGVSTAVCVQDKALSALRSGWESKGLGWQTEVVPSKLDGCSTVLLYYGSSTYDTKQMSLLIDHLVRDAQDLGIETMPPKELEAMIERFDNSRHQRVLRNGLDTELGSASHIRS